MDEAIISRIQGRFRLPLLNEGNRRLKIKQELLKIRHTLSDDDLTSLAKLFVGRSGRDLEKFSKGNIHNQSPILYTYIRVRHIFLDFKVSKYIEGYSF